jgi:hypothetical protein
MNRKNVIRLTESEFKNLISETVKNIVESYSNDYFLNENIEYNGNGEFVIFIDNLDYSNHPELEKYFLSISDKLEENYNLMVINVKVYYDTYKGRHGNYATYEEPIAPSYDIIDYDYEINPELKNMMDTEIYNSFNKFIDEYIYNNLYEMNNELENEDHDGIMY